MSNLGNAYSALGQFAEALSYHQKVFEARKRVLPPNHPDTLDSLGNIALIQSRMGRLTESLDLLLETLEKRKRVWPSGHYKIGLTMSNIAWNHALAAAKHSKTANADSERLAKEEADEAMDWLIQAVAAGWKNVVEIKRDPDLDILRERKDFKKLLAELERKKE